MITVSISINGEPLFARSARRKKPVKTGRSNTYVTDAGDVIEHNFADGAIKLAKLMLDTIQEDMTDKPTHKGG